MLSIDRVSTLSAAADCTDAAPRQKKHVQRLLVGLLCSLRHVCRCGIINYFVPGTEARSIAMSVSVCLSVRSHGSKTSRNFMYKLSVAVARSFTDVNVIRYVLPVLSMTSCLPIIGYSRRG